MALCGAVQAISERTTVLHGKSIYLSTRFYAKELVFGTMDPDSRASLVEESLILFNIYQQVKF